MTTENRRIDDLFFRTLEIASTDEQVEFLRRECGTNEALFKRVRRLVDAKRRSSQFMEDDPAAVIPTVSGGPMEVTGRRVGPYKLLEKIGEGGMGVVYMADQIEPVKRRVALKIIKPGMDSRQVIARFEAERQALAMMDHPQQFPVTARTISFRGNRPASSAGIS